jgi:hypothetical protein
MSNTFQITRKVRDAVVLNLRRVFKTDPKYTYVEFTTPPFDYDFDNTKIVISDAIPAEHAFFPAVTVDTVVGDEQRYLGPDSYRAREDGGVQQTDELFASIPMTVNINVHTIDDTVARDEIVDRIYDQFKLITDDLADAGIEIKKTRFNADRRAFNGDRWYITATISIEIYTEWTDDLGPGDTLATIPVSLTLVP